MTRNLLTLILCLVALCPAQGEAEKKARLTKWQLTLVYAADGEMSVTSAGRFPEPGKRLTHPGMNIAVETHEASVSWLRGEKVLYSTTTEVPFGNRYGASHPDGGVAVVRLTGPIDARDGDTIEVTFLGVKTRYDQPVVEPFAGARRKKLTYRIGEDAEVSALKEKTGPYAKTALFTTGAIKNRLTVVMMGDGYRAEEISSGKYDSDAQTAISAFASKDPWGELLKISNFYLVKARSAESGADDLCAPDAALPCTVTSVNTYFEASFGNSGQDRLLQLTPLGQKRAIAAADKYIGKGLWDAIIVFVNSQKYGGTGGIVATTSMDRFAPEVAVHELGHTIGKLADEYDTPYPGYPATITEWNVDSNGTSPKWLAWVTAGAPLPTPDDPAYDSTIGAFEGARYKTSGVFRPMRNCMMRNIGQPFCPVCQEGLMLKVLSSIDLYDRVSPDDSNPVDVSERARTFKYTRIPVTEGAFRSTWKVCGKTVATDVDSIRVSKSNLGSRSSCKVALTIVYDSPRILTLDMTQAVRWDVRK